MLQTLNCIRMGEVLLDENLQLFILCNNCHTDLRNLQDFRQHLEKCDGLENLFQKGQQNIKYNSDKATQLFGKTLKGIKEFLIYDYTDVEVTYTKSEDNFIDLINIEEELLDPKWYSDLNNEITGNSATTTAQKSAKQYDELVEAVTPFVQFKENLKTNNNGSNNTKSSTELKAKESVKSPKSVQFDLTANKVRPTAKRKLSLPKAVPIHFTLASTTDNKQINVTTTANITDKTYASKKRKTEPITTNGFTSKTAVKLPIAINTQNTSNILPPTNIPTNIVLNPIARKTITTTTIPTTIIKQEPTKEKQTAQILNKLQNLGLQVKRTQTMPPPAAANVAATNKTDTKTLEILQKLQSKGMKVKILNKQQQTVSATMAKPVITGLVPNPAQKTISVIRNPAADMTIKQNLNKNLIIRKVN
ncbi:hypothetical protein FF38_09757 [Lucilia cuprina]|uniref:Uncharacterized protein n=1 Tax=Lucilia cuprina TaxID=7375 RepID=A0A0L0BNS6_LUCCU|nr:hypothetical protein CVS40_5469 [Lucilia cuprina]KNC21666.1 hypothetical protein FF38_09757 [Lucilia cuprina]